MLILILAAVEVCVCTGQTVFPESEPIHHAVPLPPKVLGALLETKEVNEVLGSAREQQTHLNSFARRRFVSVARRESTSLSRESRRMGRRQHLVWILSSAENAPRIILWAGADSLEVLATRTNRHRNNRSSWSSPTMTQTRAYRFDGQNYALWKETTSDRPHVESVAALPF